MRNIIGEYIRIDSLHYYLLLVLLFSPVTTLFSQSVSMHFDQLTIKEELSHNTVQALLQDHYGYIWIGTQNGLNKFDGYHIHRIGSNGLRGKIITALFEDSAKNIWVGTRNDGVFVQAYRSPEFVKMSLLDTSTLGPITCISQDNSGDIWIGTEGNGVLILQDGINQWRLRSDPEKIIPEDVIWDILHLEDGRSVIVTKGSGIYVSDGENSFTRLYHSNGSSPVVIQGYRKQLCANASNIFVGTEGAGLFRLPLDLSKCEQVDYANSSWSSSSANIRDVECNDAGDVYIATDGSGLFVCSGEQSIQFTTAYASEYSLSSNALQTLLIDRSENIWIGTYNGGVNVSKAGKKWFDHLTPTIIGSESSTRSILSLTETSDHEVLIGTDGNGIISWNTANNTLYRKHPVHDPSDPLHTPSGNIIKSLHEDTHGRLWIGMFGSGMSMYDPRTERYSHYPPETPGGLNNPHVWAIAEDNTGMLYLGTIGGGLNVLDPASNDFRYFLHSPFDDSSISEDAIMDIHIDDDGQVWIGTANRGLDLFNPADGTFKHFNHNADDPRSLGSDQVRDIFEDSQGRLWIGSEGGGISLLQDDRTFLNFNTSHGMMSDDVMGVQEDSNGNLWITTFEGISRFSVDSVQIDNFSFHGNTQTNQFNTGAIAITSNGLLLTGGIYGMHFVDPVLMGLSTPTESEILFTELKVFNEVVEPGNNQGRNQRLTVPIEEAQVVTLSHEDRSVTISFTTTDYTDPQSLSYEYKMDGLDNTWRSTQPGVNTLTYTNLRPGSHDLHIKSGDIQKTLTIVMKPPYWKTTLFRISLSLFITGLVFIALYLYISRREINHKQHLLEAKSRILELENEKLELEVTAKNSDLLFSTVQMAHKNEVLSNLRNELSNLKDSSGTELQRLVRTIERDIQDEDYWKEFNIYFDQVDQKFLQQVNTLHPNLTNHDLRLCVLIRINLTTKEIASLLNVSVRAVEQARYRLKKRMDLDKDISLVQYIGSIGRGTLAAHSN